MGGLVPSVSFVTTFDTRFESSINQTNVSTIFDEKVAVTFAYVSKMCSSYKFSFAVSSLVSFVFKFMKFISTGIVKCFFKLNSGTSVVFIETMYSSVPIFATCSIIPLHVALWICSLTASLTFVLMIFGPFERINFYKILMIPLSIGLPCLFLKIIFIFRLVGSVIISLMKTPNPMPLEQLLLTKLIEVKTSTPSNWI